MYKLNLPRLLPHNPCIHMLVCLFFPYFPLLIGKNTSRLKESSTLNDLEKKNMKQIKRREQNQLLAENKNNLNNPYSFGMPTDRLFVLFKEHLIVSVFTLKPICRWRVHLIKKCGKWLKNDQVLWETGKRVEWFVEILHLFVFFHELFFLPIAQRVGLQEKIEKVIDVIFQITHLLFQLLKKITWCFKSFSNIFYQTHP